MFTQGLERNAAGLGVIPTRGRKHSTGIWSFHINEHFTKDLLFRIFPVFYLPTYLYSKSKTVEVMLLWLKEIMKDFKKK